MAVRDGLYVVSPTVATGQQHHHQPVGKSAADPAKGPQQGPFYLHDPNPGTIDDPVKDIFAADKTAAAYVIASPPQPTPTAIGLNTMTGKIPSPLKSKKKNTYNIILIIIFYTYLLVKICVF